MENFDITKEEQDEFARNKPKWAERAKRRFVQGRADTVQIKDGKVIWWKLPKMNISRRSCDHGKLKPAFKDVTAGNAGYQWACSCSYQWRRLGGVTFVWWYPEYSRVDPSYRAWTYTCYKKGFGRAELEITDRFNEINGLHFLNLLLLLRILI